MRAFLPRVLISDRYTALGIARPDPRTVCKGKCEGTGMVPVHRSRSHGRWRLLWNAQHKEAGKHECDGWHFVRCPACRGTGKRIRAS